MTGIYKHEPCLQIGNSMYVSTYLYAEILVIFGLVRLQVGIRYTVVNGRNKAATP